MQALVAGQFSCTAKQARLSKEAILVAGHFFFLATLDDEAPHRLLRCACRPHSRAVSPPETLWRCAPLAYIPSERFLSLETDSVLFLVIRAGAARIAL